MNDFLQPTNGIVDWIDYRLPIFSFLRHELTEHPTPRNLNYLWNFGSLAGIALVIMIVTGILLAMHYTPTVDGAFDSVEHIMRDVNYGWLIRYVHTTGASMFFLVIYMHLFRGLYYGSYKAPRELLWWLGVVILVLMMATAFFGYTLPWGQMSFWGATVITNLFSAIPLVGESIVTWLWGGFAVGNPTLNRFYALHYLLPFVIVGVVLLHLVALHRFGSNNPTGIDTKDPADVIPFHPYYTVKDLFGLVVFLIVYALFVFYQPNALLNPDNSVPADPAITPTHIVPEWYLLPYYAILRAIPNKLIGVLAMFSSIFVLFLLPWLDTSTVRSARFRPIFRQFFWILVADCVLLLCAGAQPPQGTWLILSRFGTAYYFLHFLLVSTSWLVRTSKPSSGKHQPTCLAGGRTSRGPKELDMIRSGVTLIMLLTSAILGPGNVARSEESPDQAALIKALSGVKVSLQQGIVASQREGTPLSAKFEIENGKLQLSVYTTKGGKYFEVLVDYATGKIAKVESITEGDDLAHAKSQDTAMAKAKRSLTTVVDKAAGVPGNAGSVRAVSVTPDLRDEHAIASIVLLKGGQLQTVAQNLD